jgi:hypothetical protein
MRTRRGMGTSPRSKATTVSIAKAASNSRGAA